ncbi:hypothetical protein CPJ18_11155 [Agrobacterium rosae]|uniref:Uncharacterized protein n=1 Tax=Agrobacterium rosae TaxID=1972867 RepID=A0AAE5RXD0_9HYPH|nr:hypothetical protein DXM21_04340 [Agrobacterium rosae]KAA3522737.1 hypothetical protein DXM25_04345 [Agrobacterium rosae]MQB47401.1 hypothetical protein [Agrobacterium rosae]POO51120.1 hypothetical protein CPJ18_11155 [Agrobacterium rosae]
MWFGILVVNACRRFALFPSLYIGGQMLSPSQHLAVMDRASALCSLYCVDITKPKPLFKRWDNFTAALNSVLI